MTGERQGQRWGWNEAICVVHSGSGFHLPLSWVAADGKIAACINRRWDSSIHRGECEPSPLLITRFLSDSLLTYLPVISLYKILYPARDFLFCSLSGDYNDLTVRLYLFKDLSHLGSVMYLRMTRFQAWIPWIQLYCIHAVLFCIRSVMVSFQTGFRSWIWHSQTQNACKHSTHLTIGHNIKTSLRAIEPWRSGQRPGTTLRSLLWNLLDL